MPESPVFPDRMSRARHTVRLLGTDLAIWGTLFGVGWGMIGTHPEWGFGLMAASVLYLLFVALTSRPVFINIAPRVRAVLTLCFAALVVGIGLSAAGLISDPRMLLGRLACAYVILHLLCILAFSRYGKDAALLVKRAYGKNPQMSFFPIVAIFAIVAWLSWYEINKKFDSAQTIITPHQQAHVQLQESVHTDDRISPTPTPTPTPDGSVVVHRHIAPTPTATPLSIDELAVALAKRMPPHEVSTQGRAQYLGNLKIRAITLSNNIMKDLTENGWRVPPGFPPPFIQNPMPKGWDNVRQWEKTRSHVFRMLWLNKALLMRQELAQEHLIDDDLNRDLQAIVDDDAILNNLPPEKRPDIISPQVLTIESIATRLKGLADLIKE